MSMPGTAPVSLPSTDVLALGRGRGGYHSGYHGSYHHYGSHGSGGSGFVWLTVIALILVIVALLIWNAQRDR
ncbi:hypothetical protein [Streptomyces sp. NPDC001307]|jgi:hypothetical protein|uniref:hypothetical protein n=1 Tax=Streptomyces sp. NPDC001307 TaxID=3364560 RepID=UPI0036B9E2D5